MPRKKNTKITTPVGIAQWPRLNKPDTKFNKEGIYSVSLRLTREDSEPLVKLMNEILATHIDTLKKEVKQAPLPIKDVNDQDGSPTGEIEIKFKLNAVGLNGGDRWEQRPALFDSSGKPMTDDIGGGSKIKIGAEVVPYYTDMAGAGITLRLKAVQVIELVEYTKGDSFNSWEFTQEEGFVSTHEPEEVKETAEVTEAQGFDF